MILLFKKFFERHYKMLIDIKIMKKLINSMEKRVKVSHSCRRIVYKILKIDHLTDNVANHVCNHCTKFESFPAIMSWLLFN